jgi:hypothetical protein
MEGWRGVGGAGDEEVDGLSEQEEEQMSADNWTVCPKCYASALTKKAKLDNDVQKNYGKTSIANFLILKKEAEEFDPERIDPTMREDYELGVNRDGTFYVIYSCSCNQCSFNFSYRKEDIEAYKAKP